MELGIISDTHGRPHPRLFQELDGVDHILHAGDLGPLDVLTELEAVAPVTVVPGNTDGFDVRDRFEPVARVRLADLEVVVTHGHQFGTPTPPALAEAFPQVDLVVFGHTHRPLLEERDGCWFINPGSCGPRRFDLPVSMVRAEVSDDGTLTPRLIHLDGGR
ncbi:MAG: metallophosphoesterase [Gemmatimonadales bacterium]|nr:MAG: metallophosphoesterase [Gemmatimonadales bacterium]